MARAPKTAIQSERLSNQIYELLFDELTAGSFGPGERLVELDLAERYKVSRTPVREALMQLSRDGLVVGNERGYATPTFSRAEILHRLEVKRLLEIPLAEHATREADPQQLKEMEKWLERQEASHASGKLKAFATAGQRFHKIYFESCKNQLLVRCLTLTENQFKMVRTRIHEFPENRQITLDCNRKLLAAMKARDAAKAAAVRREFMDFLDIYYRDHQPGESATA